MSFNVKMVYEFKFPDVGEGITEGTLVNWDISVGDELKKDQTVAHVETDKAVVEIPSPVEGKVEELLAEKGDTLTVGNVFMKIATQDENEQQSQEETSTQEQERESDSNYEEIPVEPNQSSQNNSSESPLAMPGVVHEAKRRGIDLNTITPSGNHGQILFEDLSSGEKKETGREEKENTISQEEPKEQKQQESQSTKEEESQDLSAVREDIIAAPSVKKLAREYQLDINFIVGTGENGRITKEDIERAKENRDKYGKSSQGESSSKQEAAENETMESQGQPSEASSQDQSQDLIPLTGIRGAIASKMQESLSKASQVTIMDEVDVSNLVDLRETEKEKLKQEGVRLSYLPFIIKALKHATKKYPYFNGRFDEEKNAFEIIDKIHMGVAVDTQDGLKVPVIKDSQDKSIVELAQSIEQLASKAKENTLSAQEMKGSTITISSIGSLGAGQGFTPILNYPEAAILGIGRVVEKPVCRNGEIVVGKTMTLSLTVDHRVIDGANAARFLKDIMELLQDPDLLLLEV